MLQRLQLSLAELDEHAIDGKTARMEAEEVRDKLRGNQRFPQTEVVRIHNKYAVDASTKVEPLVVSGWEAEPL